VLDHYATLVTLLGAVLAGLITAWVKLGKPLLQFFDDWRGAPARPGVPKRLGVMERTANIEQAQQENRAEMGRQSVQLRALDMGQLEVLRRVGLVEAQVHPNGGGSLADKVNVIADAVTSQADGSST